MYRSIGKARQEEEEGANTPPLPPRCRRSVLCDLPTGHKMLLVQEALFGDWNNNKSFDYVLRLTASAANDGCDEALWLRAKMVRVDEAERVLPNMAWLDAALNDEDVSVWALYYRARRHRTGPGSARRWLEEAAGAGFGPAMAHLGYSLTQVGEYGSGVAWLSRAVSCGDPTGAYRLAWRYRRNEGGLSQDDKATIRALFRTAASGGHAGAMSLLAGDLGFDDSNEEAVMWKARHNLYLGGNATGLSAKPAIMLEASREKAHLIYVTGRELDPAEELWDASKRLQLNIPRESVRFYRIVTGRARAACLAALLWLRPLLGRDCAVLIARRVYACRAEWQEWWRDDVDKLYHH